MQMRAGVAKKTIRSIRQQPFEATHLFDSHPESSLDFEKVRGAWISRKSGRQSKTATTSRFS